MVETQNPFAVLNDEELQCEYWKARGEPVGSVPDEVWRAVVPEMIKRELPIHIVRIRIPSPDVVEPIQPAHPVKPPELKIIDVVTRVPWLLRALQWLQVKKREYEERQAIVHLDARCPCCGHREKHKIRAVMVLQNNQAPEPFIEHVCALCAAPWYEPSVVKGEKWIAEKTIRLPNQPAPQEKKPRRPKAETTEVVQ